MRFAQNSEGPRVQHNALVEVVRAKKRRKLNYSAPSLSVAFFVRFLLSLRSFASLRFPRSLRFAFLVRFLSFLHAIIEFPSLSFRFFLIRYMLLLFAVFLSFYSFPRCTIIEFPELKAPPPPLHYVTLWSLLSFVQIAFLKRQVVIWLSHTTVA